ncbi:hypothetical protein GCM10027091_70030 [Streptomyces daliensis]
MSLEERGAGSGYCGQARSQPDSRKRMAPRSLTPWQLQPKASPNRPIARGAPRRYAARAQ